MSDELVLREHGRVVLPLGRLSERDLRAIALAPADLLRVRRVADGYELRTGSVTGAVELDGLRIRVAPKLLPDGAAVLSWLAYAAGVPVDLDHARTWQVDGAGLRDLVIAALIAECARVARAGLRLDYRREQAVDTVLRGRLDVRAQVTRRYGQIDRLHLDRFARRSDVWENLVPYRPRPCGPEGRLADAATGCPQPGRGVPVGGLGSRVGCANAAQGAVQPLELPLSRRPPLGLGPPRRRRDRRPSRGRRARCHESPRPNRPGVGGRGCPGLFRSRCPGCSSAAHSRAGGLDVRQGVQAGYAPPPPNALRPLRHTRRCEVQGLREPGRRPG